MKGDGSEWHVLESGPCQRVLGFYDTARIGDVLKSVSMPNGHVWDYKYEGGKFLTQWNPMFKERKPREVMVVYTGDEEAADWRA